MKLTHKQGRVAKAPSALISPALAPRNVATLELLCSKHLSEGQIAIAACKATISLASTTPL